MATYQKRGDRWRAIIRKKGHRPVSKSFRTKAAARKWAQDTEDGIESRQFKDARDIENTTVGDLVDRYIKDYHKVETLWMHGITDLDQISQLTRLSKKVAQQYVDLLPTKLKNSMSKNIEKEVELTTQPLFP